MVSEAEGKFFSLSGTLIIKNYIFYIHTIKNAILESISYNIGDERKTQKEHQWLKIKSELVI